MSIEMFPKFAKARLIDSAISTSLRGFAEGAGVALASGSAEGAGVAVASGAAVSAGACVSTGSSVAAGLVSGASGASSVGVVSSVGAGVACSVGVVSSAEVASLPASSAGSAAVTPAPPSGTPVSYAAATGVAATPNAIVAERSRLRPFCIFLLMMFSFAIVTIWRPGISLAKTPGSYNTQ